MPRHRVVVASDIARTPRVLQLEGLFDVPPSQRAELSWDVDLPLDDRDWHVGLIVGPSGSGKSTVARNLWPEQLAQTYSWSPTQSVVDGFPKAMGIKDIVGLLSSVGFSDPPAWLRPFQVLSNGEQFRVTMARALAEHAGADPIVVDEFTSVVDRTVAQTGCHAIAKTVRARGQRFVGVACHEDIEAWLNPDWIYRPATNDFQWRELQPRPPITLSLERVHHSAWRIFHRHHYLSAELNTSAICIVASWRDRPVAFVGVLGFPHKYVPGWRISRFVCLPDYQGVGIGFGVLDLVASIFHEGGRHVFITSSHPAVIARCAKASTWTMKRQPSVCPEGKKMPGMQRAIDRATGGFEYIGPEAPAGLAEQLLGRAHTPKRTKKINGRLEPVTA